MAVFLFLFGLSAGSFINVVIWRVPRGEGVAAGRSRCRDCGQPLTWYDLVPVISWLILRARCRHCRAPISIQYPLVELASGLFFVYGGTAFDIWLLEIFLALFVIDLRHLLLPDSIILAGLIGALVFSRFHLLTVPNLLTAFLLFGFFFLLWAVSRGRWLGLGDAKLAALIGLAFGPWPGLTVIYAGVFLGGLTALALLAARRAQLHTRLPLGSFLCLAAAFYLLWGDVIINSRWFAIISRVFL